MPNGPPKLVPPAPMESRPALPLPLPLVPKGAVLNAPPFAITDPPVFVFVLAPAPPLPLGPPSSTMIGPGAPGGEPIGGA